MQVLPGFELASLNMLNTALVYHQTQAYSKRELVNCVTNKSISRHLFKQCKLFRIEDAIDLLIGTLQRKI